MAPPRELGPGQCNTKTAAQLIMCSDVWVRKLVKEGWIPEISPGVYRVIDVVHGRIKHMQDEARRVTKSTTASRVQDARANQIELQTKKELGELVPVEDMVAFLSDTIGTLRTELSGLPAACSRDPEVRTVIENQLNVRITKCRDKFAAAGAALRSRQRVALEPEEADA